MTTNTSQEPTPNKVADLATTQARLPRLALLGIFGSVDAPAALLREVSGTTTRVIPGDRVARRIVTAIGTDNVVLARGNQTQVLHMPKG